jgi:POT family proton-dependent oligopeptide transporter
MGIWFLAASLGNILAGLLAGEFRADALDEMPRLYTQIVLTTVGSGVILALCTKPLKRMIAGAD